MLEEETCISLGDILRTIFSKKWLALIIAACITVIGTLGLAFLYSPMKEEYKVDFRLNLPGASDTLSYYVYPDGKILYYADIVSRESLEEIKASDADFKNVDVEKITSKDDIKLSVRLSNGSDDDKITALDKTFTVSVKSKYFKSKDTARKFLIAIAKKPGSYLENMGINYDAYIELADAARDYPTQLDYLDNQTDYLVRHYNSLISQFGENYTVKDDRTLSSYLNELKLFTARQDTSHLRIEARENKYLKSESLKDVYRLELADIERRLEVAEETLKTLKENTVPSDLGDSASVLKAQSDLVASLKQQQRDVNNYIDNGTVNAAFAAKIAAVAAEIETLTQTYAQVSQATYHKSSAVSFTDAGIMKTEGGLGLVKSGLISLALGIVIALVAAYIAGYVKNYKAKAAEKTATVEGNKNESVLYSEAAPTQKE